METRRLGTLEVSSIGLGCMSMTPIYGDPDEAEAVATIHRAVELGITMIDTADLYGWGANEELVGRAIQGRRERIIIATKFGNFRFPDGRAAVDGRPEYVVTACENSLRRLNLDVIDLFYIHRIDPSVPIEDTVGAMARLSEQGKIRYLGISEASPATLRRAHAVHPITALQTEYSLWSRDPEVELLTLCRQLGIGFVAYSPLGRGFLTGQITDAEAMGKNDRRKGMPRFQGENLKHNVSLVEQLKILAHQENCTPAQLALSWVLSRGDNIVALPGTKQRRWLEQNVAAVELKPSAETFTQLEKIFAHGAAAGTRYPEEAMSRVGI